MCLSILLQSRGESTDVKLTELSELAVGDDQRAESPQALERLVAVLLGSVLVNWSTRKCGVATSDLLGLPDEILQQIPLVLYEKKILGLLNHIL